MIKALRRKLIFLMMLSFTLVILSLIAFTVIVPGTQKKNEIRRSLESFASVPPDGAPSDPPSARGGADMLSREFGGSMLTIGTDESGTLISWSSDRSDYYSDDSVSDILSLIQKNGREFDYTGGYYFLKHTTPDGFSYTVLDSSSSVNDFRRSLMWGIIGGAAAWILLFLLSLKLTKMMVKPVEDAFEKQTRFISDASHELKTPIAVIQANADVLRSEKGDSKWLGYIITETKRMDRLVRDLLYLTHLKDEKPQLERLDFSHLTEGAVLPFEALAYEKGIAIDSDIKPSLYIKGNEGEIEKLVSILLSNAIKYSYDNTHVTVKLTEKYHTAVLSVRNEGEGIREEEREKVFERFYRVDKARSREDGSYGLGLAMAASIASAHHAKLYLESEYGSWAEFVFEIRTE
jgi:two-component system, OmpR family, sensor histidine kinase CiaH